MKKEYWVLLLLLLWLLLRKRGTAAPQTSVDSTIRWGGIVDGTADPTGEGWLY